MLPMMDMNLSASASEASFGIDARYDREPGIRLSLVERRNFDALYREYRDMVRGVLRTRIDNEDDVVELAQEAFLRVLRYRDCGVQSLRFLLFRISLNLATSHLRKASLRLAVPLCEFGMTNNAPPADAPLIHAQRMECIHAAMRMLSARDRRIFMLSRFRGLRQKDIAQRCGISVSSVEKRIRYVQVLLRERVSDLVI